MNQKIHRYNIRAAIYVYIKYCSRQLKNLFFKEKGVFSLFLNNFWPISRPKVTEKVTDIKSSKCRYSYWFWKSNCVTGIFWKKVTVTVTPLLVTRYSKALDKIIWEVEIENKHKEKEGRCFLFCFHSNIAVNCGKQNIDGVSLLRLRHFSPPFLYPSIGREVVVSSCHWTSHKTAGKNTLNSTKENTKGLFLDFN